MSVDNDKPLETQELPVLIRQNDGLSSTAPSPAALSVEEARAIVDHSILAHSEVAAATQTPFTSVPLILKQTIDTLIAAGRSETLAIEARLESAVLREQGRAIKAERQLHDQRTKDGTPRRIQ